MTVRVERNGFRRLHVAALAGTAALALVLSACGSDASPGSSSGATSAPMTTGSSMTSSDSSMTSSDSSMTSSDSSMTSSDSSTPSADSSSNGTDSSTSGSATETSGAGGSEPAITGDPASVKVGLAYDVGGRGDQSFNDSAAAGLDKAKAAGVTITGELEATNGETDTNKEDRLRQLGDKGANVIVAVGFAYATPLSVVAPDYPDTHFAIIDDSQLCDGTIKGDFSNVACLTFAEQEGSYLVGVAAALKSKSGKVGYIGGVNTPLLQKFQAGYEAGVKATKADATVDSKYITEPPDFGGFNAPDKGETIAKGMYSGGVDIIFAAAGGSGAGVFKAAKAANAFGIGVDSDQYNIPALADVKDVIITSMVKNVDVAVYADIVAAVNGKPLTGQTVYDLKSGGVGYSTSGGFVDDIKTQLEAAEQGIISGEIKVPTTPGS